MKKLLLLAALLIPAVWGQTAGEITGEVKDPSGASAPNATITATN